MTNSSATTVLLSVLCAIALACTEAEEPTPRPRAPLPLKEAPELIPVPEDVAPSPLIGRFESLISLEEALARTDGLPYETTANRVTEERGDCPGQHMVELEVRRYRDLESRGTLVLTFYDDKLTRAWFKTGDHEGYRQRYFALHNTNRPNRWAPAYVKPATRIMASLLGNQGVIVRDTRMWAHVDTVERACRFQFQRERGITGTDAK